MKTIRSQSHFLIFFFQKLFFYSHTWLSNALTSPVVAMWDISTFTCVRVLPVSSAVLLNGKLVTANNTHMDIYRLPHDLEPDKTVQLESYVLSLAVLPNCRLVTSHADAGLRLWPSQTPPIWPFFRRTASLTARLGASSPRGAEK
jgi:hypothetical protein